MLQELLSAVFPVKPLMWQVIRCDCVPLCITDNLLSHSGPHWTPALWVVMQNSRWHLTLLFDFARYWFI